MNRRQAEAEAVRRWKNRGAVRRERPREMKSRGGPHKGRNVCTTCWKPDCRARWSYVVGHVMLLAGMPFGFVIEGTGHSWDDAFASADRRAKSP